MMTSSTLTDDEAKLYDRSIRLWGVEAQSRIRNTSVLLVGLGGLNGEVCKNVALAGVKCIGLLDGAPLSAADIGALFLASPEHVGALSRAAACEAFVRDLNPYVNVVVERSDAAAAHVLGTLRHCVCHQAVLVGAAAHRRRLSPRRRQVLRG
jgi:ubiquitin-like 1-activating enzyme E1 A